MNEFDVPVSISPSLFASDEMGYVPPSNELSKFRNSTTAYISAEIEHPPRPKEPQILIPDTVMGVKATKVLRQCRKRSVIGSRSLARLTFDGQL